MSARVFSYTRRHLIAFLALFVALGGGSAVAAGYINGSQIKPHSIPENRLAKSAISALKGERGPRGPSGPKGDSGAAGLGASAYSDDAGITPLTGGTQTVVKQVTITTSQAGKLLVLNALLESVSVNNVLDSPLHYSVGVYVDGTPVPGTYAQGFTSSANSSGSYGPYGPLYGSLDNVAAGTHTVTITVRTTDTAVDYVTGGSGRLLVVATG
ncbi:MAG TPA: hypothetical protein VMU72_08025 [Gaiellaceae bacterium]|nr:hypothetical protein [Gaiellaceae bacterium]